MEERLRHYRSDHDLTQCGVYQQAEDARDREYRSRWYRGLAPDMEWLRLTLDGPRDSLVRVYTSDREEDEPRLAMERRAGDLLLYGVRGRYLRFTVQPAEGLTGFTLSFPGKSIDQGLPAAMGGDEVMRRFLGVYQSLYMDLNGEYAGFPRRLDPTAAHPLPWLERWVGAGEWIRKGDKVLWPRLTAAACALNRERGTRRGLERLVRLVTGGKGRLVERFQWERGTLELAEREDCARLYGAAQAVLLLPVDTPDWAVRFLRKALEDFLPMGVDCTLIHLEEGAPMDGYSYLDKNARLSGMPVSRLDACTLDNVILGE